MKPAWLSYIKKILWRYPQNHRKENNAISKAIDDGVPDLVALAFISKRMSYAAAVEELKLTDEEADTILVGFLAKIAKNLGLPTE